ncbi:NLI interacting factor [Corchorus olitorius]|uniref:Mitochondrial import inner membrane translocase subunit TIM50 n=1 Tax=Corchorus olitorius TaxID=93759 RepID=A0A1R3FXP9_9ROSI|nr:NLI interacting factor [Corchorus olitorius]
MKRGMVEEAAEYMEAGLAKKNDGKRSSYEIGGVSTSFDSFSIPRIEVQDIPVETGKDASQIFAEVKSVMKRDTKFRKRMEQQQLDSSENSGQSQTDQLPEEAVLSYTNQMNTILTPTLSDEGHSKGKVDSYDMRREYVSLAVVRPPVSHLKKKLLVLDLNGLLADILFNPPKNYNADAHIAGRAIFRRPFCDDFLRFCFERFEVGIWSSRQSKNVERLIDYLMGDMKSKLLFCWDSSQCTTTQFNLPGYKYRPLVFKELRKLWEKCDSDLPWEKGYYNESNTLLIDDSPHKALLNPPYTAIFPYSFKFDRMDNSLGAGGDLRVYLERLAAAENVQKFIEQNPFGQMAITERSNDWSFYRQVINTLAHTALQNNSRLPV